MDASHEGGLERWVKNGFLPWGEQEKSGEEARKKVKGKKERGRKTERRGIERKRA